MRLKCNSCRISFKPWKGYLAPDNESNECRSCRIKSLREWAKEIDRLKDQIRNGLTEPENIAKFNAMNSQRKKLLVFQFLENGWFKVTIG